MKKRRRVKRNLQRQYIIGGIILAVVCVVLIILLTRSGNDQTPGSTPQAAGSGEASTAASQGAFSPDGTPDQATEETEFDQEAGDIAPTEGREPVYDFSVRGDLYWNVDRAQYASDSGISSRTPDAQGCYLIRFAYDGQLVELQTAEKNLVNLIDTLDVMGLVIEANDTIVDVLDPNDVAAQYAYNVYVKTVSADTLETSSTADMNGYIVNYPLGEVTGIYDVVPDAEVPGRTMQPTELKQGDMLQIFGDGEGNMTHIFVTAHAE